MGKKIVLTPAKEVDISAVKYHRELFKAPSLSGFSMKILVWLMESPLIGSWLLSYMKKSNKITQIFQNTVIPEEPMFRPEFPPQDPEPGVDPFDEDSTPIARLETVLQCLPPYDPNCHFKSDSSNPFLYWTIRDYAYAYRNKLVTPSMVAEQIILAVEDCQNKKRPTPFFISFNAEELRKQAKAATRRFEEGSPLSVLDGVFMAVKDDIDCLPYPTKGSTTWYDKVRPVTKDAACVSRLRSCGVIFVGKANSHELGLGTTGNNPNYGTALNPHSHERYPGGSSSGPASIVASGLCPVTLGSDGGGSNRIASSFCGVVGMKTTYGRTDMDGVLYQAGTLEVVGPIASSVEDAILVYTAMVGSCLEDRLFLRPPPPAVPRFLPSENSDMLRSLRIGKYTEWFNDVQLPDISNKCGVVLQLLSETYGSQIHQIILPELQEMSKAHLISIGSEQICILGPHLNDGNLAKLTLETRIAIAFYRSFTAGEFVSAQRFRRRLMYYHMKAFEKVDVIITPTTGTTAPKIHPSSLNYGESDLNTTAFLLQFIQTANLLGFPAITVPVGHDKDGLPIGLQIMGRPWGDATVFRVAAAVEGLCHKFRKQPSKFYNCLKTEN